jgi:hypothetical protein
MACGTPVVAWRRGSVPEDVSVYGQVVGMLPGEERALATAGGGL